MNWARILAFVTGQVDQELLARNEYLAAENRILKAQLKGQLRLTDAERATLGEIGGRERVCRGPQRGESNIVWQRSETIDCWQWQSIWLAVRRPRSLRWACLQSPSLGGDRDNSDYFPGWIRSRRCWICRHPESAGRQSGKGAFPKFKRQGV
jgi:hypothetical protein